MKRRWAATVFVATLPIEVAWPWRALAASAELVWSATSDGVPGASAMPNGLGVWGLVARAARELSEAKVWSKTWKLVQWM